MSDTKISPERQFLIENALVDYVEEWGTKHEVQAGELIVCLLALATRCQRLHGQTLAECIATATHVTTLVGDNVSGATPAAGRIDLLLRCLTGKRKTCPS